MGEAVAILDITHLLDRKPCNTFVAGFMGSPQINFIDAAVAPAGEGVAVEFGNDRSHYQAVLPEHKAEAAKPYLGKEVIVGIRPEHLHDEEMHLPVAHIGVVDAAVEASEMMGIETYLYLTCAGNSLTAIKSGETIQVAIGPAKIHLFDRQTETAIPN